MASDTGASGVGGGRRLDSWKEIAAHFNRSVRTVIRWERDESLPVHRHPHEKRGSVYAFPQELDAWFAARKESPRGHRPRRLAWVGGSAAVLIIAALLWWNSAQSPGIASIAIIPLLDGAPEGSSDIVVFQLAEELSRTLSRELNGQVKPVMYRVKPPGVREDAVLLLQMVENGGKLAINAELTDAKRNTLIWSERFERAAGDLIGIGEQLSKEIAPRIARKRPAAGTRPVRRLATENEDAYREYLRGRHEWNKRTADGMAKALDHYRKAIDLDPTYALAFAGLGETYALQSYYAPVRPSDTAPMARAAASKAISIDSSLAEAYAVLAYVDMDYYWDWESAERNFLRAVELDPGWADGHHWFAEFLVAMGRYAEARAEYERALELDPLSPIINTNLAHAYYFDRDYAKAVEQCRRAVALSPGFANAHSDLGRAYLFLGRNTEALNAIETAAKLGGGAMNGLGRLGFAYARLGREAEARRILRILVGEIEKGWSAELAIGIVLAGLGDREQAILWLDRAKQVRAPYLRMAWNDPALDGLRSHPGFENLLRSMRLPPKLPGVRPTAD